jgi:hypothetical protein
VKEDPMSDNEQLLRQAIRERHPVSCVYQGHQRAICPHVLGYKGAALHLLAYQFAGESSSGEIATPEDPSDGPADYWRCMEVAALSEVVVLPAGQWYTCRQNTRRQTCVDQVVAEVGD